MEFSGLELVVIIVFNTAVCVMLPRVITLNWSEMFIQLGSIQKSKKESASV